MRRVKCNLSEEDARRHLGDEAVDDVLHKTVVGVYPSRNNAWCIVKNVCLHGKTVATRHGTFADKTVAAVAAHWLHQQPKSVHMKAGAARQWVQTACGYEGQGDTLSPLESCDPGGEDESQRDVQRRLVAALDMLKCIVHDGEERSDADQPRVSRLLYECFETLQAIERVHGA